MSGLDIDARSVQQWIADWLRAQLARLRRITPVPALVRATAAVMAVAAMMLALPLDLLTGAPRAMAIVAAAALFVALLPRTAWVSVFSVTAVLVWLSSSIGLDEPIRLWRVGLLSATLYLMHASATLAAVLPTDAIVTRGVLGGWAARTGAVLAAGLTVGLTGMMLAGALPRAQTMIAPIVGSLVAAGLAVLLAWHLRRRRSTLRPRAGRRRRVALRA